MRPTRLELVTSALVHGALAGTVAVECKDKGAVVISYRQDGSVRIGVKNFTPQELREALCTLFTILNVFENEEKR